MLEALHDLANAVSQHLMDYELSAHAGMVERASHLAEPRATSASPLAARRGDIAAATHLGVALEAARRGRGARLATLLDPLARANTWTQTSGYVLDPPHTKFLDNYAHTALLGAAASHPLAVDETDTVTLGLLLLGPGNLYPHHHHPADEVYLPVTDGRWSHGSAQPLRWEPCAVPMHHAPWQPHAARAGETHPLLVIYLWTGQRTTPAHFMTEGCGDSG